MNAALGCVAGHGAEFLMHHGFAADEEEVTDVILYGDVDDVLGFLQRDAAAGLRIELGASKAAEIAIGVADVCDGELEVAGTAVVEDFADQLKDALFWPDNRAREIHR